MTNLPSWCRAGARVVCVDVQPRPHEFASSLLHVLCEGEIYVVAEVKEGCDMRARREVGIRLREVPSGIYLFQVDRFRPVRETSIESLCALLSPTPLEVADFLEEDALS